jgi:hydrogenase maturation protease
VLGIGNPWRGDDAAGIEVARRLQAKGLRALEREGDPSSLLDAWAGESDVVLVDAVSSGAEAGTIHRLDAREGPLPAELFAVSTHHLSVAEAVELARVLGRLPERLEVYGIEGAGFEAGSGLAPAVETAVEAVAAELAARLSG